MKTKKNQPVVSDSAAIMGKKEQIGQPMLFPIFFCLSSGLLLILLKDLTMMITGYVLAAGLIIWGVWMLFQYFRSEPMTRIIECRLAIGLILLVSGTMLAFSPESLRELLPFAWGLALLFGGFLKIQYAFDRRTLGSEKWWILLILAAISLVIGTISLLNPFFLGLQKELIIGILLVLEALLDISVFLLLKRTITKNNKVSLQVSEKPSSPPPPESSPESPSSPEASPEPAPEKEEPVSPETEA